MNTDNLKKGNPDTQFRSGREAVENGRAGGIASGEARREKRKFRDIYDALLPRLAALTPEQVENLKKAGITEDEATNEVLIVCASIKTAQIPNEKGTSERHNILETYGEAKTTQDINITTPRKDANDLLEFLGNGGRL